MVSRVQLWLSTGLLTNKRCRERAVDKPVQGTLIGPATVNILGQNGLQHIVSSAAEFASWPRWSDVTQTGWPADRGCQVPVCYVTGHRLWRHRSTQRLVHGETGVTNYRIGRIRANQRIGPTRTLCRLLGLRLGLEVGLRLGLEVGLGFGYG